LHALAVDRGAAGTHDLPRSVARAHECRLLVDPDEHRVARQKIDRALAEVLGRAAVVGKDDPGSTAFTPLSPATNTVAPAPEAAITAPRPYA